MHNSTIFWLFLSSSVDGYGVGCLPARIFSILVSRFSMASSLSNICLSSLPTSSVGTAGNGIGEGHLPSSGLPGSPGVNGGG